jgi:hypothetical protein
MYLCGVLAQLLSKLIAMRLLSIRSIALLCYKPPKEEPNLNNNSN